MKHFILVLSVLMLFSCGDNNTRGSRGQTQKTKGTKKDTATVYIKSYDFNPIVNVYIENSGSMDGYVKGATDFENIIYRYLVDIKNHEITDHLNLNYINSVILPQNNDIKEFIKDLEPNTFKLKGGKRATSDISNLLDSVFSKMNDSIISVFVSDCIFSPGSGVNANEYLSRQQISIYNTLGKYANSHPDFAAICYRCMSEFNGLYYDKNNRGRNYQGLRPFYIWLFGTQGALNRLTYKVPKSSFYGNGVLNEFVAFKGKQQLPDSCYAIKRNSGSFDLDKSDPKHNIKKLTSNHHGKPSFAVEVNFAHLLLEESYLTNVDMYETSDTNYRVVEVSRITAPSTKYTHIIKIEGERIKPADLTVRLLTGIPTWYENLNDEEGLAINDDNREKTFGIKYMIKGVAESIIKDSGYYTEFEISINNK